MTTESIQLRESGYALQRLDDVMDLSNVLRSHIKEQKLYTMIREKAYAHVEAWQMAGACFGLYPVVESCDDITTEPGVWKYRAVVAIMDRDNNVKGRGIAICSKAESRKSSFDEYAIASMAQTRAVGKAFRLLIGWVLKTAGYETTPAEEMDDYNRYGDVPLDKLTIPFGEERGKPLSEMEYEDIAHAISWARAKTRKQFHGWAERADEYLVVYHETAGVK
jgi:hypothetical protein